MDERYFDRLETIKKGKRLYGHLWRHIKTGTLVYVAHRRPGEIFRDGLPSISAALRAGRATWAYDEETVQVMRLKGVKVMGVHVPKLNEHYFIQLDKILKPSPFWKRKDYSYNGGANQRYVFVQYFWKISGLATSL